ncbi:hypothetical protein MTR67_046863 [Solanum verrucosum]|uniref:4-coumarate--CoA ligase n=1 Tax=Solanum verrucosum TaxID=315347 RepID=A0AAF0ZXM3_SOLVR|nr:probable CoA ligase CCL5 [Solanum verrucosum]WMV53478.1 hypothetical protein MTR67_046863 [Solanum verrucosum]
MSSEGELISTGEDEQSSYHEPSFDRKNGYDSETGIYHSVLQLNEQHKMSNDYSNLDTAKFVLSQFPSPAQSMSQIALIDSSTNQKITYTQLNRSILSLATGLYRALGVRKGDVIFVLSSNSIIYPTICLAILSIGAILSPANPLNTESEIHKQVRLSRAKLAIAAPEEVHKLVHTGVPTLLTTRSNDENSISVQELIENCDPLELPKQRPMPLDTAAILYSSGTTGISKGVVITHANFVAIMKLLKYYVEATSSQDDVFLCFVPMFHVYGLAFFGLGLFCSGVTTVLMQKFDLQGMLEAIQTHKISHIPAVPPVILGLVKYNKGSYYDLSSLRSVTSGAAPLSKEVADAFREKFPWVELKQGYGLTETTGAATFFVNYEEAKARPSSVGVLFPGFSAKVINHETGEASPPFKEGELWLKGPGIMKEYFGNEEATSATITKDGWLKTGDLCYFDDKGYLYIIDRIKELIKHNGYQVAPAELEAILLSHHEILDAAVVPLEDEEAGQIPLAYVVRAANSGLTQDQVIQFVSSQVAPYKKVRRVNFINAIPRSAAGKILRKELVLQSNMSILSKL